MSKTPTTVIHIRIDDGTHQRLSEMAKEEDRTLGYVAARVLRDGARPEEGKHRK